MANIGSSTLPSRDFHCKVCNLYLNSADSLEVHLQYHKENLYVKWGTQNRENDCARNGVKVNFETTVSPADSSDGVMAKPNPDIQQRATPETSTQFTNPGTPQSYHSAPSPYQNPDLPAGNQFGNNYTNQNYTQDQHTGQMNWEQLQYNQDYKPARFHPYSKQDRGPQVSSSSPLYVQTVNQPTLSPSHKQCDKCGFVCESASQLNEHCNSVHGSISSIPAMNISQCQQFSGNQYDNSNYVNNNIDIKEERDESSPSNILDLDSQKVVYQDNEGQQSDNKANVRGMSWEYHRSYDFQSNCNTSQIKSQNSFDDSKPKLHPVHKLSSTQGNLVESHEPKLFMQGDQDMYSGLQMPQPNDNFGFTSTSKLDMKPPYRPYDPPAVPQITSTQPAINPTSSNVPSIVGKGANWKSNEPRRPKTYNCTACNKWFTSSGHLKRHYNTTLHKNAVKSSGQPDPATVPISNHHHPVRDSQHTRTHQKTADSNNQNPVYSEDSRSIDDGALQTYSSQNSENSRVNTLQSQPSYVYQGNLDNNNLANYQLQYQIGSQPVRTPSQQPVITIEPKDENQEGSNSVTISTSGNHPNGEAGPSVSQNLRDLLSVTTSNVSTITQSVPPLTQTLPSFNHLGINPYSPGTVGPLVASVPNLTHNPMCLTPNFQETITMNYPNGMSPHVMDTAINSLPTGSPVIFGESSSEKVDIMEQDPQEYAGGRLPSFAQLQTGFNIYVYNHMSEPNVGGQVISNESTDFVILDPVNPVQYNVESNEQTPDYNCYIYSSQDTKDSIESFSPKPIKVFPYGFAVGGTTIKHESDTFNSSDPIEILKMEEIMDYTNKENYGTRIIKSPSSPESAKIEIESCGSPAVTSTVSTPLLEKNLVKKSLSTTVHKCYECDKVFNKACYLTQHNKTFHSGEKPFKCDRCGKRFADDVSYEGHCQKHSDNKPFKCSQCPKSFNHKTDLRRHMCLHSGSKPFACDHCGKGFIRKDHMVKHYEIHLKKGGSRVRVG